MPSSTRLAKLKNLRQQVVDQFHLHNQDFSIWLEQKGIDLANLRSASQQILAGASIIGALHLQPTTARLAQELDSPQQAATQQATTDVVLEQVTAEEYQAIITKMVEYTTRPPGHLPAEEELYLEQQLSDMFGFEVSAELEGHRLNHTLGIMGGEQHLPRFPGDTLDQHDAFLEAGITANRGAFGWFTEGGVLTDRAIAREKYYFAVQTLYLPDWNSNHKNLKPWYAFRKMIAINPADQVAVVGVVGDAGPAQWVNKQFGGSPEVIREAKIWSKTARGRVILYFVDDPEDKIPLGVIDLAQLQQAGMQLAQTL